MMKKEPIYTLDHGIKVISERKIGDRIYCYIEEHPLFPTAWTNAFGRQSVQRARVVMTAHLGRALRSDEHVHHKNKRFKTRDTIANLEVMTSAEHNRHHKTGSTHRPESKAAISQSLKRAFRLGLRKKPDLRGEKNPFFGHKHTDESKKKMSEARR
jgi:hypothetical protein